MAAYAALVSLTHTINEIEIHPSPPISFHKLQLQSLTQKVNSLLQFLHGYTSPYDYRDEPDPLEISIAAAAHAAEDSIDSFVFHTIHDARPRYVHFYEALQKVIQEMYSITAEVAGEKVVINAAAEARDGLRSTTRKRKSPMVGFEEEVSQLMELLIGGNPSRQIIPIVEMGGIGKTTLVTNVFDLPVIKRHFHVCFWPAN